MSIMRAASMFLIGAFAPVFNRENDLLSSLLSAVALLLIIMPFAIVNVSFLLSVLATLAIVWIMPFYSSVIAKKLKINSKILITSTEMLLTTVFATLFTLPVIICVFGFTSVLALITNIFVTYFITASLILNCCGLLLSAIPIIKILGYFILLISNLCCKAVVFIVNIFASLPVTIAKMPTGFIWLSILLILLTITNMYLYNYSTKKRK